MISEKEYKNRRKKLASKLKGNGMCILHAAQPKQRSHDTNYPYRQNSHFYYLSGFKEDTAAIVLLKKQNKLYSYLFVYKKEYQEELWNGKRLGVQKAKKCFVYDDVFVYDMLGEKLKEWSSDMHYLYYDFEFEEFLQSILAPLKSKVKAHYNVALLIEKMRLVKSKAEISLIKKALQITKDAHHKAMQVAPLCHYEYELQAHLEYVFKKNGAYSDAYTSIVACGNNANTLHYISNDKKLKKNALILIDAGCEYEYYASDITRTIPASGHFNKAQREIYTLVLQTQKEVLAMIAPNVLRSDLQKKAVVLLTQGLVDLGILEGDVHTLIDQERYKKYYPHGIGHWMGLDVHDEAPYVDENNQEIPLQKGMVLTIEPGLYFPKEDKTIPKKYRGIGIRIEDDILITKDGYENLSKEIKKELQDIESFSS